MTISIVLQFVVVLAAIWLGSRSGGVGLGLWGAVGLLILAVGFGVSPTSPPVDVMLIILAVIMAAVAAATGLAVIACWEAMVATAMGRSGRMPFWWAVS